jgi:hypothetical protein
VQLCVPLLLPTQSLAQISFERAQRTVINAGDDFLTLLTLALVADPQTGLAGSAESNNLLIAFVQGREFEGRSSAAEQSLMRELDVLLGFERRERFIQKVWPGIRTFGFAVPMTTKQVVAPN